MGLIHASFNTNIRAGIFLVLFFACFHLSKSQSYCSSTYTNTSDEWISAVAIGGMVNASGSLGYSNFTGLIKEVVVTAGVSYAAQVNVTVKTGSNFQECVSLYFDWNQDGDFSDASERFQFGCQNVVLTVPFTGSITVPASACHGLTRMRVIMQYNSNPPANGCASATYGEVEDYTVYVDGGSCGSGCRAYGIVPSVNGSTQCGSGNATLTATSNGGTPAWYASNTSTNLLGAGNTFTPFINGTTTYYVAQERPRFSALNTGIGGGGFQSPSYVTFFTVTQPTTLAAVTVYPSGSGNVTVTVRNAVGVALGSVTQSVPGSGARRILLGFNLPVGVYWLDAGGSTTNLYRNSNGGSYPYSSSFITITGNSFNNNNYYYYFYDWETDPRCPSSRRTVQAVVNPIPTLTNQTTDFACGSGQVTMRVSPSPATSQVRWYLGATGGNVVGTGSVINTFNLTATTIFYADAISQGCVSASRLAVTAEVRPIPADPVVATAPERCGAGSISLSASSPSGGSVYWYDAQTGGNLLNIGNTYNTSINATTTYYTQALLNGCLSTNRTAAMAILNPSPPAPSPIDGQRCGPGAVTLGATAAFGISWYTAQTGGTLVNTGPNYTVNITDTTTFWVETFDGKCISNRNAVTAILDTLPNIPALVTGDTICGPGAANLSAVGSGGMLNWYDAATGGTQIGSGNSIMVNPMQNTSYWVEQVNPSGCISPRGQADVLINAIPADPSVQNDQICGPDIASISASAPLGVLNWYDAATGGNLVFTGPVYTPFEIASTTYYVEAEANNCLSNRVPVNITVNPIPSTPAIVMADTICGPGIVNLEVSQSGGIVLWEDTTAPGIVVNVGATYAPNVTDTTTWWVQEGFTRPETGIPLPAQLRTSAGAPVGGYWFQTPEDILLTGFRVPVDASAAPEQEILVVKLLSTPTPGTASTPTFEVIKSYPNTASTGLFTDTIPALAGTLIGVLGIRGGVNSLAATGPQASMIEDAAVTLNPLELSGGTLAAPVTLTASPLNSIGRVEMYYQPVCLSGKKAISGLVVDIPPAPVVQTDSTCGADTIMLSATGTGGTLRWYDADSAGILLTSGSTFMPLLTMDSTFYVEEIKAGCISTRAPVQAEFFEIPDPPVLTSDTICGTGQAMLSATSAAGTITWYVNDSISTPVSTGPVFTPTLTDTTTFWVTYSDANCTSSRRPVTALVNAIPPAPQAFDVQVCGNDTAIFQATGTGGILIWYDQATGGTPLDTGAVFAPFLQSDRLFWVEEQKNGCTSLTRSQTEGLVNTVPDPPEVFGDGICEEGLARLRAVAKDRVIDWYDADSAGNLVFTGTDFTVFVEDTTTLWVQVSGATVEKIGPVNPQLGSGGMSTFYTDGVTFDVVNPTTLKEVSVFVQDSGRVNIRLLDQTGRILEEASDTVATSGEHVIRLDFPLLPGTGYHLDAVGTTTGGLFRNNENAQFPYAGADLTLTGSFNGRSDYFYFFYNWEVGNCESPRVPVSAIAYPKASRSVTFPPDPASFTASYECLDEEGWTHYFYDLETPEKDDDILLFSIYKDNQEIGSVGDGTFRLRAHASDQADGGGGNATAIRAPYVTNVEGWWVMNRYWEITPNPQPERPVRVRFYYNEEDLAEINNALIAAGDSIMVSHEALIPYIVLDGNPNPDKGHLDVGFGDFRQFVNGLEVTSGTWVHGSTPAHNYAEFEVSSLYGGGAGKGGGDKGALSTGSLSLTPAGSFVILDWKALSGLGGDHFEIEKSLDGTTFTQIGETPFVNDSVGVVDYTFTDISPTEQLLYYRVKFVFADSNFTYTNIASINFLKAPNGLLKLYPNPTDHKLFLEFSNIIGSATFTLIDMNGREVFRRVFNESEGLTHLVRIRHLGTGFYLYRIQFQDHTEIGKLFKIH